MRRSGDVLIACVLLAIPLPLPIITAGRNPIREFRPHFGK